MSQELDRPWRNEEKLREMYVVKEMSLREISNEWDCSHNTVGRWVENFGFDKRDKRGKYGDPLYRDCDFLRQEYLEEECSAGEIAEKFDCTSQTILYWLKKHKIPRRRPDEPVDNPPWQNEEKLRHLYWECELESPEIADKFGCTAVCIWKWLVHYGIDRRRPAACRFGCENPSWKEDRTDLRYSSEWSVRREEVLERDDYTCAIPSCQVTDEEQFDEIGFGLNVHHIVPLKEFRGEDGEINYEKSDAMENLISLCHTHHRMYEGLPLDIRAITDSDKDRGKTIGDSNTTEVPE
ncbi:HNH endonuclease signature motif containing protein [Natronococcus sp. A-GB7]|uniref:HNH endonuclease n=1 Tax=Natronococcus sp. A-GB7 TaxID=3037649 RepID=UPI00241D63E4|nr:HNH endonuclease signature motif containing protein [Natronococcus sp. A-GB7]MDG5821786.1 HNH endonuclease signature motif containing protein [Natronococcus sp. A-GB7]